MQTTNQTLIYCFDSYWKFDDITLRAIDVLKNSDLIICEDTRRTIKLLSHFKIKKKLVSYHKFNEQKQISKIIEYFNEGKILSLVSDAGTPMLSDPGRLLVNHCIEEWNRTLSQFRVFLQLLQL